jgi:two-component system, LuxR family, response regulator FixJ
MMPANPNTATVFVVDDDPHMRQSLSALLEAMRFSVRAFSGAESFHRFYQPQMPGVLLLDVQMPVQSGLQLYKTLLQEGKRLPVIFITAHADVTTAVAAMKTGAIEFLEKPFDRHSLVELVRKALELDAQWREQAAEFTALKKQIDSLSERDRETLDLILAGESNKSMAVKLFITERAVEMRRASIMRKLKVRTLPELLDLTITYRIRSELHHATTSLRSPTNQEF